MTSRPHMQFFCMIQKLRTMVEVMPHSWLGASHGFTPLVCLCLAICHAGPESMGTKL